MASRPLPLPSPDGSRAVLIGVHRYSELDDLPAVERNVRRLRELFTDPDLWGLPDDHCVTVLDDDDPRTIPGTIREAARAASDLLVVYYAGHGLLPYDTDRFCLALPSSTKDDTYRAVRYEAVRLAIASAGPDVAKLVILDCCFAARALDAAMGGTTQSLEELSRIEGACTLTASDETSIALAPPGETYTAFTGELISAIENGVPGAPECLDVATLYRHLTSTLESKGLPLPQLFSRGGGGNLRLVRNRAAASQHAVDLPDGLRSLVEAQLRAADDFPYRLVGARRSSLSAVYVRQQMTESRPDREMEGPDTVPGSAPERSAQASASVRTLEDALRLHPHLVITGGPGLGKSTTTLQLAGQLAQALIDPSTPPPPGEDRLIPLRVTATALAEGHAPLFRRLRDAAAAELGLHLDAPLPGDLLEHPPQGCTWLLIVDGVDEITDPVRKDALIRQLAARTADGSGLRLLITTRPLPGTELETLRRSTVGHYQLERFTPERLREFAERWFGTGRPGGRTAEEFLNAARRAGPSELVRVPLLATITAIVYEQSPSAALPGNRYVLYQHYLSYLRTARAEATSEQWRRIRNRIGDVPGADPGPLDYLPELLEHLAEKAVGGTSDVKPHAIEWMERHGGGPLWVPEWPDLVAGFLDSTGLFVHTPARQRFIHHSFAEHLAGQAAARRLAQEFDPESPAWTGLVHRAKKDDQVAITALVAHSQDNPSGAPLLRWLEEGPGTHRTLAGELLAEGIRATERDEHVRRLLKYCDRILWGLGQGALESLRKRLWQVLGKLGDETVQHFLRASAVDPRRLGHDRLQAIQALPPGTNDDRHVWLRAIGLDPAALPGDRISALRDLARLDPQTREEAVKAMRAIVNAADAAPLLRSVAAEELAEAEPGHTDEAITALRQIMADDAVQPTTRSFAARSFATIAPSQTEEAVTVLHEIINSSSNPWERAYAADDLGAIEPRHAAEATTVMRECLNHPSTTAGQRTSIARWFADLGPDHTDEAVERLHEIIRSPACSPSVRQHAAEALSEIAPDRAAETTGSLMELISAPGVPADERVTLAETLTAIAPDRSGEIDVPLRRIIEGPDTTTNTRVHAAGVLATRVAEISAQGTRVLDEILTDATLKPTSRLRTVRWLRETGQWDIGRTARAVHEIMDLPGTPFTSRNRAAKWLTEFGPPYRDLGVRALEEVIAGPGPLDDRIHAALTLEELGDEQRVNAVTAVRRLMKLPPTGITDRSYALQALHSMDACPRGEIVDALRKIMSGAAQPAERRYAAVKLGNLALGHAEEAAEALRQEINGDNCGHERLRAAEDLGELSPTYRGEAINIMRACIMDADSSLAEKKKAAQSLVNLGRELENEAAEVFREIIMALREDPSCWSEAAALLERHRGHQPTAALIIADFATRSWLEGWSGLSATALALGRLGPAYVGESLAVIREVIAAPDTPLISRAYAAANLIGLSPSHRDEGIAVLEEVLADPLIRQDERSDIASWLNDQAFDLTERVAGMLRDIISDQDNEDIQRVEAAWRLARRGHGYLMEGMDALSRFVSSSDTAPIARAFAAERLTRLDSSHVLPGGEVVREVLAMPGLSLSDRALAAALLANMPLGNPKEAADVLVEILSTPGLGNWERELTQVLLGEISPGRLAEVAGRSSP